MYELDHIEPVTVTLSVDDWATVVVAMGQSGANPETKSRINSTIFRSAEKAERIFS